jgi:CheY-like chemotaxis protein
VEDEPAIRALVAEVLVGDGYAVAEAADGLEALDILRTVRPAAITLDLTMPRVDGWQFLACYEHLTGRPVPVVVTSAVLTATLEQRLRALGAHVCLPKPFALEDLLDSVQRVLDASLMARSMRTLEHRRPHLREVTEVVTRRLDASHARLIRAEDTLGWSQSKIAAYYAQRGLALDGSNGATQDR